MAYVNGLYVDQYRINHLKIIHTNLTVTYPTSMQPLIPKQNDNIEQNYLKSRVAEVSAYIRLHYVLFTFTVPS